MDGSAVRGKGPQPCKQNRKCEVQHGAWLQEKRAIYAKTRRQSFHVELGPQPKRAAVNVDTTKARSSLDVLRLCLRDLAWREYSVPRRDGCACDIYWHSVHFNENPDVLPGGKVNKFPGMVEVMRKVNLGRTLDILQALYPEEYHFHPISWFLPQQFTEFCDAAKKLSDACTDKKHRPIFIVKPDEGSQGEGIYLIHEPKEYLFQGDRKHIVQEYIARPLLLENLKFDLRVYVLVSSLDPLEIFICKEGLARFCTVPYQYPTNKNIHETFMHLTNYSLNKKSDTYLHTESGDDGSKRTMTSVFKKLRRRGYDVKQVWADIEKVVVKTILAAATELRVEYRAEIPLNKPGPTCFQILGFDILLTHEGKPVLLEVNANPSLRIDYEQEVSLGIVENVHSPVDELIKRPLVMDTLLVMAPRTKARRRLKKTKHRYDSKFSESRSSQIGVAIETESETEEEEEDDLQPITPHKGYGTMEQIYPVRYSEQFSWLTILDRAASIFLECLGVRGNLRMGPTGFRTYTRKCKIQGGAGTGLTNAALDIMYIDLQRRWEHHRPERGTGLCYQGFIECFFNIAKKRFPSTSTLHSVQTLLDFCETNMEYSSSPTHKLRLPMLPPIIHSKELTRLTQEPKKSASPLRRKDTGSLLSASKFRAQPQSKTKHSKTAAKKDTNGNVVPGEQ